MKKLRIAMLAHVALVPSENPSASELVDADWRAEYEVREALRAQGHRVEVIGLYDDLTAMDPILAELRPHIVFNLMEEFDGVGFFDQNIVSYLELMRLPYTGCNPRGLMLARDKALAKKLLAFHGIPTPPFEVYPRGAAFHAPRSPALTFPMMVKTLNEEASFGISRASVVTDLAKLEERVKFIHRLRADALVESFVGGRELYVGVLGNGRPESLPVRELYFDKVPDPAARIATRKAKWDRDYRKRNGIRSGEARDLPKALEERLRTWSKEAYRALGLTGYARLDWRLSASGEPFLLEANPNPHIGADEDFARSAKRAGLSYDELLGKIVNLGLRWKPAG
jgi:D-alanine-D-alanine ligase